jgi:hypothetical protein
LPIFASPIGSMPWLCSTPPVSSTPRPCFANRRTAAPRRRCASPRVTEPLLCRTRPVHALPCTAFAGPRTAWLCRAIALHRGALPLHIFQVGALPLHYLSRRGLSVPLLGLTFRGPALPLLNNSGHRGPAPSLFNFQSAHTLTRFLPTRNGPCRNCATGRYPCLRRSPDT